MIRMALVNDAFTNETRGEFEGCKKRTYEG